jgi:hypothetical protein
MRTKTDKIFDNTFDESESDGRSIKFKIETDDDSDVESRMYSEILIKRIDELIRNSDFNKLNHISKDGKTPKLSKTQMSLIYTYIITNVKDHSKIDIFAATTDYFDIQPAKFYNSLSNTHKEELILELDKKMNILEKKRIRKLF